MVCKIITFSEKGAYIAPYSKIYTIQTESCILDGSGKNDVNNGYDNDNDLGEC